MFSFSLRNTGGSGCSKLCTFAELDTATDSWFTALGHTAGYEIHLAFELQPHPTTRVYFARTVRSSLCFRFVIGGNPAVRKLCPFAELDTAIASWFTTLQLTKGYEIQKAFELQPHPTTIPLVRFAHLFVFAS